MGPELGKVAVVVDQELFIWALSEEVVVWLPRLLAAEVVGQSCVFIDSLAIVPMDIKFLPSHLLPFPLATHNTPK